MKNFTWKELLRHHPIFSNLNEQEAEQLLEDDVSEERDYPQGSVILRERELGNSIFLIGSGSVQVVLPGKEGQEISLSILRNGEFFGEMALFQQRPRSATVIAREHCTLLEIRGEKFLQLANKYPDIELKVLLTLSERLRHANEEILAVHLKDIDEKLNFFNIKLDAELKVFDALMKAAQTVFDQTRARADEVINSAERSRTRVSFFLTTAIAVLGLLGFSGAYIIQSIWNEFASIKRAQGEISDQATKITRDVNAAQDLAGKSANLSRELESFRGMIDKNRGLITETRVKIANHIFLPAFSNALKDKDTIQSAIDIYDDLRELKSDDPNLPSQILEQIEGEIITQNESDRINYTEILWKILENAHTPDEKMISYFLLLANAVLIDIKSFENGKTFDATLAEFKRYMRENKNTQMKKQAVDPIKKLFDKESPEMQKRFQPIKELISTH